MCVPIILMVAGLWLINGKAERILGSVQQIPHQVTGQTHRSSWTDEGGNIHWTQTEQVPGESLIEWTSRHRAAETALMEAYGS